jgi:hypothetical protein
MGNYGSFSREIIIFEFFKNKSNIAVVFIFE